MNEDIIPRVRAFNRYYTAVIGLLDKNYLDSDYSLTEVRILYELNAHPGGMTAKELIALLGIDKGYMSRTIDLFVKDKLVQKSQAKNDKRAFNLALSEKGGAIFQKLDLKSGELVSLLLSSLTPEESIELTIHMEAIKNILQKAIK